MSLSKTRFIFGANSKGGCFVASKKQPGGSGRGELTKICLFFKNITYVLTNITYVLKNIPYVLKNIAYVSKNITYVLENMPYVLKNVTYVFKI